MAKNRSKSQKTPLFGRRVNDFFFNSTKFWQIFVQNGAWDPPRANRVYEWACMTRIRTFVLAGLNVFRWKPLFSEPRTGGSCSLFHESLNHQKMRLCNNWSFVDRWVTLFLKFKFKNRVFFSNSEVVHVNLDAAKKISNLAKLPLQ